MKDSKIRPFRFPLQIFYEVSTHWPLGLESRKTAKVSGLKADDIEHGSVNELFCCKI